MDVGFSRMNEITIIQTTQGLAQYLIEYRKSQKDATLSSNKVVIGFDHRHKSKIFADFTAHVFLLNGFDVYMYDDIVATPLVVIFAITIIIFVTL